MSGGDGRSRDARPGRFAYRLNGHIGTQGAFSFKYGFAAAPYTATEEGESVGFTASATSETEGEMDWTGTVSGDMIEGEVTWAKEGQDAIDYEFTGALQ